VWSRLTLHSRRLPVGIQQTATDSLAEREIRSLALAIFQGTEPSCHF